jgi:hypothetical protein
MAENMMQHAEHYFRIIAASNEAAIRNGGRPYEGQGNGAPENQPEEAADQGSESSESEDYEQTPTA